MNNTYTSTGVQTFTITHARHIASKVAADLKRMQRFYGNPSDERIQQFETEVIELLRGGYLERVTYGYQKNGNWIAPTLRYTAKDLAGMMGTDDDPGRVPIGCDINGAVFKSFLSYSSTWEKLSPEEQNNFEKNLPFQRSSANEPGVSGYISTDKTYSSGGRALERSTVKNY